MNSAIRREYPQAISYKLVIAAMLLVLLLIMGLTNSLLLRRQRLGQLQQVKEQLHYQLQAASTFMIEPLLKYQLADVEQFMRLWVENHSDVLLFEAHTPSDKLLSRFTRSSETPYVISDTHRVEYQGHHLLTLTMSRDYTRSELLLDSMRNRLLLFSLLITAVLGVMLWLVFRRLALTPLENEIKRRRTVEQELTVINQELDAFAYSVSHDLRAPLRGIDGFSLALLEDYGERMDDTGHDYIRRIRKGCLRMGELIDDMLQLSRLSRGKIKRQSIEIDKMAKEALTELQKAFPERKVEIKIQPELQTQGDPVLARAVLDNLLGNAWKFTAKNDRAAISVGQTSRDGRTFFFVKDNGVGFNMAYADKIFTPFQRLHSPEEFEGTGIGMATVQRIIHRHGGVIIAEGVEGKGATFYFSFENKE